MALIDPEALRDRFLAADLESVAGVLGWSTRTKNVLTKIFHLPGERRDYTLSKVSLMALLTAAPQKIRCAKGMGAKSLEELEETLAYLGFVLGEYHAAR